MKNKIIFKTLMLKGEAGSTIVSMEKTGHVGTADIYTITFNDGSTTEISLENMSAITSVEKTSSTDTEDIYTITCADGSTQTFSVLNHNADIAAMSDDIDTIDARVDNFINSVVPNTVETLWTGSIQYVGDSATLSKAVSNFDYIDLYLLGSADSKYIRVPATQTAVEIQQQNLSDDASSNFLRLWEMGVSISGSTVSITKSIAWAWDDPNNSNPTVTANAQNGVPITRIDGVKVASDTPAEVTDIRVGADGTKYNSAGAAVRGQISDLDSNITNILNIQTINPVNWIDETVLTVGRILYNGTQDTSESYKTTDFIPVENGDILKLYNTYVHETGVYALTAVTGERLALYDADKNYLAVSGQYPCNTTTGYTVSNVNAKYIKLSYSASYSPVELCINESEIPFPYTAYFAPYKTSVRLDRLDGQVKKIIDCWGDSRTEMNIGTSYSDYLAALLGDPYIVSNHGLSGQSIGQVSFRYGANEVYLTLDNNAIPASGSVDVTGIICSVGSKDGNNMETADSVRGSRCTIRGVTGMFVYHRNGTKTFTRDSDGVAVGVTPNTKAIPTPYFDASHMQILWAGKNDFSYGWPDIVSGIEENYDAMAAMIPHDKFVILGETYSNAESYAPNSTNRGYVDSINAYLADKYPNNFINIQTELVTNGLTLESITPTAQDEADIADGFIPSSLMADVTHPNQYGREAIAKIIYAWMQTQGWV